MSWQLYRIKKKTQNNNIWWTNVCICMCSHLRRSTLPKQHCTEIVAPLLNAAPASREHKSGPVHGYINSSDGAETVAPLFIFCRIINMFTKADNLPTTIQCCVQHLRASRLFLIKWKVCGFLFLFFLNKSATNTKVNEHNPLYLR